MKSRVKGNDFGGEHRVDGSTGYASTIPSYGSARGQDREPAGLSDELRVDYAEDSEKLCEYMYNYNY